MGYVTTVLVAMALCLPGMADDGSRSSWNGAEKLVLSVHSERTSHGSALWGLVSRESRADRDVRFLLAPRRRDDGLLDLSVLVDDCRMELDGDQGHVSAWLRDQDRGREVAVGTWSPETRSWRRFEIVLRRDEMPCLDPSAVRAVMNAVSLGHDFRVSSPAGDDELTMSFDYPEGPVSVSEEGRIERRATVIVSLGDASIGEGTFTLTGDVDPDVGVLVEGEGHLDIQFSQGLGNTRIRGTTTYRMSAPGVRDSMSPPVAEGPTR